MNIKASLLSVWILVFFMGLSPIYAQDSNRIILVQVDGLSCPFCSYGLEKKLKKLNGVEKVEIHMRQGKAEMRVKSEITISDESIKQAVVDAGFTPGIIERSQVRG